MKKNVLKGLFFAPLMLIGIAACAQDSQSAGTQGWNASSKEVEAQKVADPAVLAKHLETAPVKEVIQSVPATISTITEVDYTRLQGMSEAQRLEILGNSDKYKVINQPK